MSASDCSLSVLLDSPSWITGMLDAEYVITSGGVAPCGIWRTIACADETVCAMAVCTFAPGCRNTFTTAMPGSDVDSMCSMLLTVVVRIRSCTAVMRLVISEAEKPL